MTRSLGDLVAKTVGVTHEPEIKSFSNFQSRTDRIVVVASDGLWDRIPNDEITRMLIPFYERRDPDGAASRLMQEAADRWQREQGMIDDITIIVIFLSIRADSSQVSYISNNNSSGQFGHHREQLNNSSTNINKASII